MAVFENTLRKGTKSAILEGGTNNQAELSGMLLALEWLAKNNLTARVYTDSQYVCKGYNQWMQGWATRGWKKADGKPVLNKDYWQRLYELKQQLPSVQVLWIKGHSGHIGNELADTLCTILLDDYEVNRLG